MMMMMFILYRTRSFQKEEEEQETSKEIYFIAYLFLFFSCSFYATNPRGQL
jgi:hypothetical protein